MLLALLLLCPLAAFAGQANVFIYHRFNDSRYPSTNVSNADFRAQLELLQQQNVSVLTLGEVIEKLADGLRLPQRCAVISIDDAYDSFLSDGWPLLKRYGFPATLFVSTDLVGGGDYLDWQELRGLRDEGVEIGNHTASHAYLLDHMAEKGWAERILADLRRSQSAFREHLGEAPRLFAYPYGEFSPELVKLVKAAGFHAAFGQQSGVIAPGQNLFTLPRFPIGGEYTTLDAFRSKLIMKPLPVRVIEPVSPVLADGRLPRLRFSLPPGAFDATTLRCYVPGQRTCSVRKMPGDGDLYEVEPGGMMAGRRSKYTVTASDSSGAAWYWFSQLWVLPRR